MARIKGWRTALFAALDAHRGARFRWGEHDCALVAADAVAAMTGEDLASSYRGLYSTAAEALALLSENGFADAVEFAATRLPDVIGGPMKASTGDLAVVPVKGNSTPEHFQGVGNFALGVVTGATIKVMTPRGLGDVPLAAAVRAFRVE
jgi:hypothetical protein